MYKIKQFIFNSIYRCIRQRSINNSKCGRTKRIHRYPRQLCQNSTMHTLANKMATSRTDFIHDLCRGSTLDAGGGPQRKNSGKFSILDGPPIKEREARIMGRVFSTIPPQERSACTSIYNSSSEIILVHSDLFHYFFSIYFNFLSTIINATERRIRYK